ncbi:MAG: alkaline shock response membrane anchor protein AmaP [Clostridia bacterium]|nr:alkaline shock response membrane anchor protein AmaP [Clostridia bacterium]MDD4048921.1 alkaline shock response membrane anchor protein AmaP [Clostridia bacterium]
MTNFGDRFIIGILSLGYVFASVLLTVIALGWPGSIDFIQDYFVNVNNRWILGLTSTFLFIVTFTLFLSSFKAKPAKMAVIKETKLGKVNITLSALEQLILKASKSIQGVRDVKPIIKTVAGGISILVKIQVIPDINISKLTEELQETIKEYLLNTSGTSAEEIKIQVTRISWDTKVSRVE